MTLQHFTTIAERSAERYIADTTLFRAITQLLTLLKTDAPMDERQAATQAVEEAMAKHYTAHYEH